jgi:hypothetical protein
VGLKNFGSLELMNRSFLKLWDAADAHSLTFQAPTSLAADVQFTVPGVTGTTGQVLTATDGVGGTAWQTPSGGTVTAVTASGPLASSGGSTPNLSLTGLVPIANGGTGQATAAAAITALTGTQTAGTYLRSDGTNATLTTIQAGDVPTLNQNTTGTASNITASSNSTLTTLSALSLPSTQLTGTVALANGGTGSTAFATGAIPYSSGSALTSDAANLFYDSTNHQLGVGTTSPLVAVLDVRHTWGSPSGTNLMEALSSFGDPARLVLRRADGTSASPTAVQNNDVVGLLSFSGYNGSAFASVSNAAIQATAAENFTPTANGTLLTFATTATGTTSSVERMRITSQGFVGVGAVPGSQFDVVGKFQVDSNGLIVRIGNTATTAVYPAAGTIAVVGGALGTPTSIDLTNAVNLPLTAGVTGVLPTANGGTNQTTWTAGSIPFLSSATQFGQDTTAGGQLFWDATDHRLGIGTATPATPLEVSSTLNNARVETLRLTNNGGGASTAASIGFNWGQYISAPFTDSAGNQSLQFSVGSPAVLFQMGDDGRFNIPGTAPIIKFSTTGTATIDVENGTGATLQLRAGGDVYTSQFDVNAAAFINRFTSFGGGGFKMHGAQGQTNPFLLVEDSAAVAQFQVASTGAIQLGPTSGTPTHSVNTATGTPSNAVTPAGYISITVNGTLQYLPYYT